MQKFFLLFACVFTLNFSFGQSHTVDSLLNLNQFTSAKKYAKSLKNENDKNLNFSRIYNTENRLDSAFYFLFQIDTLKLSSLQKAYYHNHLASSFDKNNEFDLAFFHYDKAKELFLLKGLHTETNEVNLELYIVSGSKEYLDLYYENAKKNSDYSQLTKASMQYALYDLSPENKKQALKYFNDAFFYNSFTDDLWEKAKIHQTKGLYLMEILGEFDSVSYHYDLFDKFSKEVKKDSSYLFYSYVNRAALEKHKGNIAQAAALLEKADSVKIEAYRTGAKKFLYNILAENHQLLGNFDKAYNYLELSGLYRDSLDIQQKNINLTRFETEKRERENLILQQKNEAGKRLTYIAFISLALVLTFGMLIYKNLKKKQFIAEQQRLIEIQKTENLLKTQELNALDAMLLGQEKERQRLAGELHDSVGATLTALKIQFSHIQKNTETSKELENHFQKTNNLIEEAYQEVRSIAHLKNSGVIAKNGLLPAIKQLAKNASGVKNLNFEVQDFGLEKRLENSLEIAIFRIIQELVTNIIKHAEATEASILLTNHTDVLNIIIEDNGKGFKTNAISKTGGMGITNIEKRVEHMGGTMEIDSSPGKGTSIIINIPI